MPVRMPRVAQALRGGEGGLQVAAALRSGLLCWAEAGLGLGTGPQAECMVQGPQVMRVLPTRANAASGRHTCGEQGLCAHWGNACACARMTHAKANVPLG